MHETGDEGVEVWRRVGGGAFTWVSEHSYTFDVTLPMLRLISSKAQ